MRPKGSETAIPESSTRIVWPFTVMLGPFFGIVRRGVRMRVGVLVRGSRMSGKVEEPRVRVMGFGVFGVAGLEVGGRRKGGEGP